MRRMATVVCLAAQLVLAGCGGGGAGKVDSPRAVQEVDPTTYDSVIAAIGKARIPVATCAVTGGGAYEAIPAQSTKLAQGVSYLQYTDGRAYELGPCDTPPPKRAILRMYHFVDAGARDAAVDAAGERGIRPTSSWKYQDNFTIEIWMDDPADTGPVGQAASAAHLAIGAVPGMRHVQVGNNR